MTSLSNTEDDVVKLLEHAKQDAERKRVSQMKKLFEQPPPNTTSTPLPSSPRGAINSPRIMNSPRGIQPKQQFTDEKTSPRANPTTTTTTTAIKPIERSQPIAVVNKATITATPSSSLTTQSVKVPKPTLPPSNLFPSASAPSVAQNVKTKNQATTTTTQSSCTTTTDPPRTPTISRAPSPSSLVPITSKPSPIHEASSSSSHTPPHTPTKTKFPTLTRKGESPSLLTKIRNLKRKDSNLPELPRRPRPRSKSVMGPLKLSAEPLRAAAVTIKDGGNLPVIKRSSDDTELISARGEPTFTPEMSAAYIEERNIKTVFSRSRRQIISSVYLEFMSSSDEDSDYDELSFGSISKNHRLFRDDYQMCIVEKQISPIQILPTEGTVPNGSIEASTPQKVLDSPTRGVETSESRSPTRDLKEEEKLFLEKKAEARLKIREQLRKPTIKTSICSEVAAVATKPAMSSQQIQLQKVLIHTFNNRKKQTERYRYLLIHVAPYTSSLRGSNFSSLPLEAQLRVIRFLDIFDLINVMKSSKYWYELISRSEGLWYKLCRSYFGDCPRSTRLPRFEMQSAKSATKDWLGRFLACVNHHYPGSSETKERYNSRCARCICYFYKQLVKNRESQQLSNYSAMSSSSSNDAVLARMSSRLRMDTEVVMFHKDEAESSTRNSTSSPSKWKKGFLPRKWVTVKDKDKDKDNPK
eukprot:TRINITY_DN3595_c0_g3_i1.p1 TRINITY_DN3595_c0_g3~~TRINITY_DN3595_c0_g3_i1.p1  ORF type:complete len:696 (+),score=139.55 TRINITY_DN3595_c0_g3_i1:189-2276(+)